MVHGQRMYLLCNGDTNGNLLGWNAARTYCQSHWPGFDLVSIRNADEQAFIPLLLVYGQAWIGFTDRTDIPFPGASEGTWVWSDASGAAAGSLVPWTVPNGAGPPPWCSGKPNGGNAQNCANAVGDVGGGCWDDGVCGDARAFICAR